MASTDFEHKHMGPGMPHIDHTNMDDAPFSKEMGDGTAEALLKVFQKSRIEGGEAKWKVIDYGCGTGK